jgi:hypothetical protein
MGIGAGDFAPGEVSSASGGVMFLYRGSSTLRARSVCKPSPRGANAERWGRSMWEILMLVRSTRRYEVAWNVMREMLRTFNDVGGSSLCRHGLYLG